jgi:nucleotide-binding universal stress UspA family protein
VARILQHFTSIYVPHPSVGKFEAEIVEGAERKLQEFVQETFPEGCCRAQVVLGDAAEEILNYAEVEGIDLIIMGTHGRKGDRANNLRECSGVGSEEVADPRFDREPVW